MFVVTKICTSQCCRGIVYFLSNLMMFISSGFASKTIYIYVTENERSERDGMSERLVVPMQRNLRNEIGWHYIITDKANVQYNRVHIHIVERD